MSIRLTAFYIFVTVLSIYAWKDWFKSLCGLILLMAIIEHEDMPKTMFGIQGFNMWNIMFLVIFLAWLASRRREGLMWDMPRHIQVLLLMFLAVILFGFLRAVFDRSYIEDYPLKSLFSEELINTIKWVLPGILLFDGCRTRHRVVMILFCLLALYFLVSLQVIRFMPAQAAIADIGVMVNLRSRLGRYIGYSACDISGMLAGASWGILAALPLVRRKKYRLMVLVAAGMVAFGQALTGGRAGYVAWGATGLVLCLLKWRKYLILTPVVVILLPVVFPSVVDRMLTGFGVTNVAGQSTVDDYAVTSGRTETWPHVIDKIGESPWVGYGRLGMTRSGLREYLRKEYGEDGAIAHPHNVYLETLLDNGILGSLPISLFWGIVLTYSSILFRSNNRLCSAVGGLALALTLAQLFAGIGAQHYYPRISTTGLWAATFLMIRVYVEEAHVRMWVADAENSWDEQLLQQHAVVATA